MSVSFEARIISAATANVNGVIACVFPCAGDDRGGPGRPYPAPGKKPPNWTIGVPPSVRQT